MPIIRCLCAYQSGMYVLIYNLINLITVVTARPDIKYLNRYVRDQLAAASASGPKKWYDLGLTLMGKSSKDQLGVMKIDKHNTYECCEGMFNLWLERDPEASWSKLIAALKLNNLNTIADDLTRKLGS